jgi:hypothetical protein
MKASVTTLVFAILATLGAACSSGHDAGDSEDGDQGALAGTSSSPTATGSFAVTIDGHKLKFDYRVGSFDLTRKTAVWNAKVTDRAGTNASDDVNVAAKITNVARCMGCFTVEVPGGSKSDLLAVATFDSFNMTSLTYEGQAAKLLPASGASTSTGGAGSEGSADDVGACTQSCNGDDSCKAGVRRRDCASGTGVFPVIRCPTSYDFVAGGTCPR